MASSQLSLPGGHKNIPPPPVPNFYQTETGSTGIFLRLNVAMVILLSFNIFSLRLCSCGLKIIIIRPIMIRLCLIETSRGRCKSVESRAPFDSSAGTETLQTHDGKAGYDFRFRWAWQRVGYRRPGWRQWRHLVANVGGRRLVRASFVGRRQRRAPCWPLPARWPAAVSTCCDGFETRSSPGSRTVAATPPEPSALSWTGSA